MDGIPGLTSIVPIIPDQSIITDRSGMSRPPVEIMPLPSDSFMSEDAATTELLKSPFTLDLDTDGHSSGAADGGNTAGRSARRSDRAAADAQLMETMLGEAYTLSLGSDENTPTAEKTAREISRMKEYETLGKAAARQINRKRPETDGLKNAAALPGSNGAGAADGEEAGGLLSRIMMHQRVADVLLTAQNDAFETLAAAQDVFMTVPETPDTTDTPETPETPAAPGAAETPEIPPETAGARLSAPTGGIQIAAAARQNLSLLSGLSGMSLSASDIETIMTLEPELQEAFLNMLTNVKTDGSAAPNDISAFMKRTPPIQPPPDGIDHSADGIPRAPYTVPLKQSVDIPEATRAARLSGEDLTLLAAQGLAGRKTQGEAQILKPDGSMAYLGKISELPYSLYLFGNVDAVRKGNADAQDPFDPTDKPGAQRQQAGQFLRVSEAVKMAAVLHSIYYGGSGQFPEETPWYAPYVRYAVKNGIIENGEFDNYNEYATRAETAYIFSNCVPRAELPILNHITDIPDVVENAGYGAAVYRLYRAGVLKRNSGNPNFFPESRITKTEAATIIGRIATPEDRKVY